MVKIRNVRLTDVYGRDFETGEVIDQNIEIEQEKNINQRIEERINQKIKESAVNGKIYVEGLGRVTL